MSIYDRDYMRDEAPSFSERLRRMTAFHWFFWANILVFIAQWVFQIGLTRDPVSDQYLPSGAVSIEALSQGHVWTPFTYMFVHGSVGHLLVNMLMMWFAGKRVQDLYGPRHFVLIYVISGLAGAALQIVLSAYLLDQPGVTLIGASASVLGLVLAYAVAMPEEQITLLLAFIIPVRVRLWGLAKFLLLSNLIFGVLGLLHVLPGWLSGGGGEVAYFAHVGGALAGWYYARSLGYGPLSAQFAPSWDGIPHLRRRPVRAGRVHGMKKAYRPTVELDTEAIFKQNPTKDPIVDLMREEVDPILDKINDYGLNSLTEEERRTLDRASRQMAKTKS